MRVAGLDSKTSRELAGVVQGTYNAWTQDTEFSILYRQLPDLAQEYKQEAIQLLRRENQLEAILIEGKILRTMKEELDAKDYDLIRTNIAREVYSKLMNELDITPKVQLTSWRQHIQQFITEPQEQIEEGVIDGTAKELPAEASITKEH